MSIIELLQKVGAENTLVQQLNESVTNATASKKHRGTLVTFATNQFSCNDLLGPPGSKVGLIIWIPREKLDAVLKTEEGAEYPTAHPVQTRKQDRRRQQ